MPSAFSNRPSAGPRSARATQRLRTAGRAWWPPPAGNCGSLVHCSATCACPGSITRSDRLPTPGQVQRHFSRLLVRVDTPARAPRPRGKSPGRRAGQRPAASTPLRSGAATSSTCRLTSQNLSKLQLPKGAAQRNRRQRTIASDGEVAECAPHSNDDLVQELLGHAAARPLLEEGCVDGREFLTRTGRCRSAGHYQQQE